jgi:hypothetical protein
MVLVAVMQTTTVVVEVAPTVLVLLDHLPVLVDLAEIILLLEVLLFMLLVEMVERRIPQRQELMVLEDLVEQVVVVMVIQELPVS